MTFINYDHIYEAATAIMPYQLCTVFREIVPHLEQCLEMEIGQVELNMLHRHVINNINIH